MERRTLPGLLLVLAVTVAAATPSRAATLVSSDEATFALGGDVKAFFIGIWPYDHFLMPEDPIAQGALDFRLKMEGSFGSWMRYGFHHTATAQAFSVPFAMAGTQMAGTGGSGTPEAADLSWSLVGTDNYSFVGRMDRAWFKLSVPHLDLTVGRQPISFGSAYFFTPMDLVAPFTPTTIDREYKPGFDAVRADAFFGTSGKITVAAAYVGDGDRKWHMDDVVIAGHGSFTLGVYDIGLFFGSVHRDLVWGVDFVGAIGPVGVQGEATLTKVSKLYKDDDRRDWFVRAVLGANVLLGDLNLMAEVYYQSIGKASPEHYLLLTTADRYERGEIWAMGRWYAALSAAYALTPLINVNLALIANLQDPSMLIAPGFGWSVGNNVELGVGGYVGLGQRPGEMDEMDLLDADFTLKSEDELLRAIPIRSEFGLTPAMTYVQIKVYF